MLLLLLACAGSDAADSADAICPAACERLYDTCHIERAGRTQAELVDTCVEECEAASAQEGELGDYNPYERAPSSEAPALENRAQAELWAECIDATACDQITDGYCAPVW